MIVIEALSRKNFTAPDTVRQLAATLAHSLKCMDDRQVSIVRLQATSFLKQLRAKLPPLVNDKTEQTVDLLSHVVHQEANLSTNLKASRDLIFRLIKETCAGHPDVAIYVHRPWDNALKFHVDTAALTIIFPLHNAPTLYTTDQFVDASRGESLDADVPLRALAHAEAEPSSILSSATNEIVLLKGAAWCGTDAAIVHGPPSYLSSRRRPKAFASAIILEFADRQSFVYA